MFVFVVLFVLCPVAIFYMLACVGERLDRITLVNIVTVSMYAFSVLGTFPLFFLMDEYRVESGVVEQARIFLVFVCSFLNIAFFLCGVFIVRRWGRLEPKVMRSVDIALLSYRQDIVVKFFFVFVCYVLYVYLRRVDDFSGFSDFP